MLDQLVLVKNLEGTPIEFVGSWTDITDRKQAEENLSRSQRLESVGRLAGGIAHDFNNLLTAILGYSEILNLRFPAGDPSHMQIEEIQKAAERAAGLTRQLLAFSRKQILQPRVISINSVVSEMDRMLRRLLGEDIDIVTKLDDGLWNVRADPGQIEARRTGKMFRTKRSHPSRIFDVRKPFSLWKTTSRSGSWPSRSSGVTDTR